MAQPAHKATTAAISVDASSPYAFTIVLPAAAADYDIIIVGLFSGSGASTFGCGGGTYTSLGKVTGASIVAQWFYKRVMAGEGDIACTSSGADFYGYATMYTGCSRTLNPCRHITLSAETTDQSPYSSNITPTISDTRIIAMASIEDNNSISNYPPASWTGRFDAGSNTGTDGHGLIIEYNNNPTINAQLNAVRIATQNASDAWVSITFALVPQYITGPSMAQKKQYLPA